MEWTNLGHELKGLKRAHLVGCSPDSRPSPPGGAHDVLGSYRFARGLAEFLKSGGVGLVGKRGNGEGPARIRRQSLKGEEAAAPLGHHELHCEAREGSFGSEGRRLETEGANGHGNHSAVGAQLLSVALARWTSGLLP
jgi:hypothetical protein